LVRKSQDAKKYQGVKIPIMAINISAALGGLKMINEIIANIANEREGR
jgi:hypothetical protein